MSAVTNLVKELSKHVTLDGRCICEDEIFYNGRLLVMPNTDPAHTRNRIFAEVDIYFDVHDNSTWGPSTHKFIRCQTYDTGNNIIITEIHSNVPVEQVEQELLTIKLKGDF